MVCLCCSGVGCWSVFINMVISLTLSSHMMGILSPKWMCKGAGCTLNGLYYDCDGTDCSASVPDPKLLVLALLVTISNILLLFVFCVLVQCSKFKYTEFSRATAMAIGGWYITQEMFSLAILIIVRVEYGTVGWAAWAFTIPGIALMIPVAVCLVIFLLCPHSKITPTG